MDYKSHGNDYFWWVDKAEEMLISSTILEKAYNSGLVELKNSESNVYPNECRILPVIIYLKALALELYLKATILKTGKELVDDEGFVIKTNHNLPALAQEAKVTLNSSERALLGKLTNTINFWGRYPIPKTKALWRIKVEEVEGTQPIWLWSEEEAKLCNLLLDRLRKPLG